MKKYKFSFEVWGNVIVKVFNETDRGVASDQGSVYTTMLLNAIQMNFTQMKNFEIFYAGTNLFNRNGVSRLECGERDLQGYYAVEHIITWEAEIIVETEQSSNVAELAYDKAAELLNEVKEVYPDIKSLHVDTCKPTKLEKLS